MSDDTWFGPPSEGRGTAWETTEEMSAECARAVVGTVEWLVERDRYRILDCRTLEDLYGGRWVTSQDLMPGVSAYTEAGGDPVKLNFAKNAVDFVQAKLTKEVPAVVATAHGGGYSQERRADLLSRFIDQVWGRTSGDDLVKSAVLHALRTGTAIVKTHASSGRPDIEIVPAEWCFVDQTEARCGETRTFYERRPVARRYLLERFVEDPGSDEPSEQETAILGASAAADPLSVGIAGSQTVADLVHVYEAWSLPEDLPDAEPGRHVICVEGAVLLDEEWRFPRLPHALFRFDVAPVGRGFWAQGLLSQVDEAQAEIDYLLAQVSEQIRMARLKVFVPAQDQILKEDHLADSAQGTLVRYDRASGPPSFTTPPSVSREALEHIQWLVKELYEAAGMSEQGASSQRPAGVNSGRAILYFHDFQTQRFIDRVAAVGRFVVDIVERLLDRAEELHSPVDDGDGSDGDGTGTPRTDSTDELTWARVRMDRDSFALGLEQISPVPRTYSGREQRIEQLIAQGQLPPSFWTEYLSNPDAWRAEHRAAAQAEFLDWVMSELEDPSKDVPPVSDKMDFALALEVLGGETLTLIRKGADQEIVDRFEEYFDRIVQRQKELAPQGPEQGGPGGSGPTAPQLPNGGLAPTQPG